MWEKQDLYVPEGQSIFTHDPLLVVAQRSHWHGIQMEYNVDPVDYPVKLIAPFEPVRGLRIRGYQLRLNQDYFHPDVWARIKEWEREVLQCRVAPGA
jgi:hypothetical protein